MKKPSALSAVLMILPAAAPVITSAKEKTEKMKKILFPLIILILIPCAVFGETPAPSASADIVWFRLYRNDFMMPQNYEIFLLGDAYYLYRNDDLPILLDPHDADDLVRIIDKYDVRGWDGFDESDPEVEDGEFFFFSAVLTDGTSIRAGGQNAFPPGYSPAAGLMEGLILRADGEIIEDEDICGTYVYEGEGCGGDFTITINKDETYAFSEGPLSSYTGRGSWTREQGRIIFNEENGRDMRNSFAAGNNVLLFLGKGADDFPCVPLSDGGKFIRQ